MLLAEQWDVPPATAAYGIFAEGLAKFRKVSPSSPKNLVEAASRYIAKHKPEYHSTVILVGNHEEIIDRSLEAELTENEHEVAEPTA
jgi:pheromone shutdown protein TraB